MLRYELFEKNNDAFAEDGKVSVFWLLYDQPYLIDQILLKFFHLWVSACLIFLTSLEPHCCAIVFGLSRVKGIYTSTSKLLIMHPK
jgi:hypothetical protein